MDGFQRNENVMEAIEFAKLVQQMRAAQKRYFAQRDNRHCLRKCENGH